MPEEERRGGIFFFFYLYIYILVVVGLMVVVDGVYIYCHAEGKESRRSSMYFLLACVYHFATYYRRRKVEVVHFYFSVCMCMLVGGEW